MKSTKKIVENDLFSKEVQFLYHKMNDFDNQKSLNNNKKAILFLLRRMLFFKNKINDYIHWGKLEQELPTINKDGKKLYLLKKSYYNTYLNLIEDSLNYIVDNFEDYHSFVIYYLPQKNQFFFLNDFGGELSYKYFKKEYAIFIKKITQEDISFIKEIYINSLKDILDKQEYIYLDKRFGIHTLYLYNINILTFFDQDNDFIKKIIVYLSNLFLVNSLNQQKLLISNNNCSIPKDFFNFKPISLLAKEESKGLFYDYCKTKKDLFSWKNRKSFQKDLWNYYIDNYPYPTYRFLLKLRNLFY